MCNTNTVEEVDKKKNTVEEVDTKKNTVEKKKNMGSSSSFVEMPF